MTKELSTATERNNGPFSSQRLKQWLDETDGSIIVEILKTAIPDHPLPDINFHKEIDRAVKTQPVFFGLPKLGSPKDSIDYYLRIRIEGTLETQNHSRFVLYDRFKSFMPRLPFASKKITAIRDKSQHDYFQSLYRDWQLGNYEPVRDHLGQLQAENLMKAADSLNKIGYPEALVNSQREPSIKLSAYRERHGIGDAYDTAEIAADDMFDAVTGVIPPCQYYLYLNGLLLQIPSPASATPQVLDK